ncbi:MAG: DNA-binding protein [Erysipelotrichaceae bacterium]|nr:DNA-binding protein [Erysipelotrichaceae bacterium]
MRELAFRLRRGSDLRQSIEEKCKELSANTAVVLSGVGSLYQARIRLAKATEYLEREEDFEIVSLTGTVSRGKAHIHISLADEKGNCLGGHLEKGCLVNTTCELVLGILEEYETKREFDSESGYDEIVFTRIKEGEGND